MRVPAAEPFVRLSDSPLWALQRAYFEAQGPMAWSTGTVPHYVTSNPFLARAFAEVIEAFGSDAARAGAVGEKRPLYIVELGAGSGRLGYQIVRALRTAAARGWRPVYVMTDFAEATVAWWRTHPWLQALFAAGVLDVARFDAEGGQAIELVASGRTLSSETPAGAMVVVANYLFDSLPHDVFERDGDMLYECVAAPRDLAADPAGDGFERADLAWRARVAARPCYGEPLHERALDAHDGADGVFTFPIGALRVLDRLRGLCRGPMLVLAADKGASALADVMKDAPPSIVMHGSVSLSVNFHAIGAWALAQGGAWMHPEHAHHALEMCAFVVGAVDRGGTLAAFERAIARRSPDDFYALKRVLVAHAGDLTLDELLAYLRLSGHDARLCLQLAPAMLAAAAAADGRQRLEVADTIARIWDGYLPIGETDDLAFLLASLAESIGASETAASLCRASLMLHGERPDTLQLLDACERRTLAPAVVPAAPPTVEDPFAVVSGSAPGMWLL